jgi:glutathione S-transferase
MGHAFVAVTDDADDRAVAWQPGAIGRLLYMTSPRLYYMPRTRSSRVLWLLEEIGAPYELAEISGAQRRSEEHLRRHPLGRVPALELGDGATMFESAAICLQLADLNPGAGLIGPVGSTGRGLVYQWVVFAVSELEGPLFRWLRELDDGVIDSAARDRFAEAAAAMQSVLAERDWLVEDSFGVADVMCASVLQGASARGLLGPWPALEAYVQRAEQRPAYARAAAISDRPRS